MPSRRKKMVLPQTFKKGHTKTKGRQKGTPNKITRELKEALILAAEKLGSDGRGKDGTVGYLAHLGKKRPELFAMLLGKLLPLQVTGDGGGPVQLEYKEPQAIAEAFKQRGLPLPKELFRSINRPLPEPKMIDVTPVKKDEAA